jgi:hypothetical protein
LLAKKRDSFPARSGSPGISFQGIWESRLRNTEDGRIPGRGRPKLELPTHEPMSISQFDFQEVIESFFLIYGEKGAKAMENLGLSVSQP